MRKAMPKRFHAFIEAMASVRLLNSASVNRRRVLSKTASDTWPSDRVVTASVQAKAARSRSLKQGDSRQQSTSDNFCSVAPAFRASFQCMSLQKAQALICEVRR